MFFKIVKRLFEKRFIDIRVNKFGEVGLYFVVVEEVRIFGIWKLVIGLFYFLI